MKCRFCEKECKNSNSQRQHEVRCKLNPDAIKVVSNFIKYNQQLKDGEKNKEYGNQYTKAEKFGLEKPKISKESREKMGKGGKNQIWDDKRREQHSRIMSEVALNNPEIYSNKQKRTTVDYNGCRFDSPWELKVAQYLDSIEIKWRRPDKPIPYKWNEKWHLYYPDFHLPEHDIYIEVKGYETDRDKAKWQSVNKIIILKQKEIKQITSGTFVLVL